MSKNRTFSIFCFSLIILTSCVPQPPKKVTPSIEQPIIEQENSPPPTTHIITISPTQIVELTVSYTFTFTPSVTTSITLIPTASDTPRPPTSTVTIAPKPRQNPTKTPAPALKFAWSQNTVCGSVENRVHNRNLIVVQVTGFIKAKSNSGTEVTIAMVPNNKSDCPADGWCGPIGSILDNFAGSFQGEVWRTTWVHYQGKEVDKNSFGPDQISCGS